MKRMLASLVLVSMTLVLCGTILSNEASAQTKSLYTHRTTCVDGSIIQVPVVCTPNQQVTVTVHCPGELADRITWRCPDPSMSEKISDKLVVALRVGGGWGKIPGTGHTGNDDFWSTTGDVVIQLRNFLGPDWGLEFASGIGAGFYPNGQPVFYGVAEGGINWHPGKFEAMFGYNAGVGASSYDTLLHRHTGVLRLRYYFMERLGLELAGHLGWGSHVWETSHEYQKPNPDDGNKLWWYEDTTTRHCEGITGSVAAGLILKW